MTILPQPQPDEAGPDDKAAEAKVLALRKAILDCMMAASADGVGDGDLTVAIASALGNLNYHVVAAGMNPQDFALIVNENVAHAMSEMTIEAKARAMAEKMVAAMKPAEVAKGKTKLQQTPRKRVSTKKG